MKYRIETKEPEGWVPLSDGNNAIIPLMVASDVTEFFSQMDETYTKDGVRYAKDYLYESKVGDYVLYRAWPVSSQIVKV